MQLLFLHELFEKQQKIQILRQPAIMSVLISVPTADACSWYAISAVKRHTELAYCSRLVTFHASLAQMLPHQTQLGIDCSGFVAGACYLVISIIDAHVSFEFAQVDMFHHEGVIQTSAVQNLAAPDLLC